MEQNNKTLVYLRVSPIETPAEEAVHYLWNIKENVLRITLNLFDENNREYSAEKLQKAAFRELGHISLN